MPYRYYCGLKKCKFKGLDSSSEKRPDCSLKNSKNYQSDSDHKHNCSSSDHKHDCSSSDHKHDCSSSDYKPRRTTTPSYDIPDHIAQQIAKYTSRNDSPKLDIKFSPKKSATECDSESDFQFSSSPESNYNVEYDPESDSASLSDHLSESDYESEYKFVADPKLGLGHTANDHEDEKQPEEVIQSEEEQNVCEPSASGSDWTAQFGFELDYDIGSDSVAKNKSERKKKKKKKKELVVGNYKGSLIPKQVWDAFGNQPPFSGEPNYSITYPSDLPKSYIKTWWYNIVALKDLREYENDILDFMGNGFSIDSLTKHINSLEN
jgi:hypothetical protein